MSPVPTRAGGPPASPPPKSRGRARFVNGVHGPGTGPSGDLWVDGGLFVDGPLPAAEVVDLHGGFVVRGFADAHAHVAGLGRALEVVDLVGAGSWAECVERVRARLSGSSAAWLLGRGWDQNDWPGQGFPDRAALDAAFPGVPIVLTRVDGHALIASSAALDAAGISRAVEDPPGGRWLRRADGDLTGVAVDAAMAALERAVPKASAADRERWLLRAFRELVALGLTAVHDMGMDRETLDVLRALDQAARVPLRVYVYTDGLLEGVGPGGALPDGRVRVVGVKLFADGALGSRGAALLAPYHDEASHTGLLQMGPEALHEALEAIRARGLQPAIHAIGDRAVRVALDALAAGERVEHAQVVAPEDISRFASKRIWASMQPVHQTSDMPWAEARLGGDRVRGAYAWKTLHDAGARLAFGTDFPVESPDPRVTLWAAVSRAPRGGGPAWYPEERLSREVALAAMTSGAAAAVGEERPLADFVVFDKNLLTVPIDDVLAARVLRVVVGGVTVFPE